MYLKQRLLLISFVTVIALTSANCQTLAKNIEAKSQSVKTDIFQEVNRGDVIAKGYTTFNLKFSLKTHSEDHYLINGDDHHGKPTHKLLVNIDGQAVLWEADGKDEDSNNQVLENGKKIRNAESGKGTRYTLTKILRLKPGKHTVFVALPEDNYRVEFDVTLNGNNSYVLNLVPRYYRKRPTLRETYLTRFKGFDVYLNEQLIHRQPRRSGASRRTFYNG